MAVTQRLRGWTRPDASTLAGQRAVAGLRVVLGLLWLYNVEWKVPPDFGRSRDADLYRYVTDAVEHPVFPPYSWLVEHLVMPNFTAFGWTVLLVESLLAACLLTGTLTRLAGAVGVLQALAIALSVARTPGEWPWAYVLLIGGHVVLASGAAGRAWSVDGALAGGPAARVRALRVVGGVTALLGMVAVAAALGDGLTASPGTALRSGEFQVGLGVYNLLGALVLLVLAALALVASTGRRAAGLAGAALALVAVVSVWARWGRGDVLLGGNGTTAAAYLAVGVALAALCWPRADAR